MEQQNDRSPDTARLYAWLSRDQDGQEGIVAVPIGDHSLLPLVFADEVRSRRMASQAQLAAQARGFPARLVVFERTGEPLMEVQ